MITNFDFNAFKKPLKSLKPLINANISFYDDNYKGTHACTEPADPFCEAIKKNWSTRCADCDYNNLSTISKQYGEKEIGCHYYCHFGLKEMAFKMTKDDETYGYIIVGPFRDPNDDTMMLRKIDAYCTKYALDKKAMIADYFSINEFSEEKYEAIKTIVYTLFDYAISQKMIRIKSNLLANEIVTYIRENIHLELTTKGLAKSFFISEKKLCELIKEVTGLLPNQFITQTKVMNAKTLLDSTKMSIRDVALSVGMTDYNYFTKVFKQQTGLTPTQYRRHNASNHE